MQKILENSKKGILLNILFEDLHDKFAGIVGNHRDLVLNFFAMYSMVSPTIGLVSGVSAFVGVYRVLYYEISILSAFVGFDRDCVYDH